MSHDDSVSRRGFLCAGAAAAAAAAIPARAKGQDKPDLKEKEAEPEPKVEPLVLPKRKLGKTGVEVTMLGQGAGFGENQRHLTIADTMGVRYLDTAKVYLQGASERTIAEWFGKNGRRKDYFLVTKDIPHTPEEMLSMVDDRLEALKTDYIDLFFLHALGDSDHYNGLEDAKWFADKEWIKAADKIRKSGKARFVGFSTHTDPIEVRIGMLNAAAKGGWVDAIMVGADPVVIRENADFNKALDACHSAGIGLVSMKECRTQGERIGEIFPSFKEKGLSPFTAVLSAMWTDERFASVCSHMKNLEELKENATACSKFKPLTKDELAAVCDMVRGSNQTFCNACDGSCRRAAGTNADLNAVARYVNYAEVDGRIYEARKLLTDLAPEARNWSGADLAAASHACKCKLDFASIVKRAEELMA